MEFVDISSLSLDTSNARKHSKKNIDAIKGSLAKFGLQKPIVISKDNIVLAGNGTLEAAIALKWKEIGVIRSKLTGTEAIAYSVADNRTGELAEWDDDVLGKTLEGLKAENFDLDGIGFDDEDLAKWLKEPEVVPGCGEDEIPEKVETRCKLGDLWVLDGHRLLCGDSTDILAVERLMGGEKADMVFTDPPYGVNERTMRKSAGRGKLAEDHDFQPVIGDHSNQTAIDAYRLSKSLNIKTLIFWGGNYYCNSLPEISSWIVWDKRNGVASDDNADCELAWCNNKKPARVYRHLWKGCIRASEKNETKVHPTQKPIMLAEWCFENYGNPKTILDLFLGSGSTLIACEKTNRKCYGMEIDPHYCDIIIERWQKYTGKEAKLLC